MMDALWYINRTVGVTKNRNRKPTKHGQGMVSGFRKASFGLCETNKLKPKTGFGFRLNRTQPKSYVYIA